MPRHLPREHGSERGFQQHVKRGEVPSPACTARSGLPGPYAGTLFRSHLEARWAIFFDHLDLKWEYEPQGFDLGDGPVITISDLLPRRRALPPPEPEPGTWIDVAALPMPRHPDAIVFGSWHPPAALGFRPLHPSDD